MRFLRLLVVLVLAVVVRGAMRKPAHFDLSATYTTHLFDRTSVDLVESQLRGWEHQLRARGFNTISNSGGTSIKSSLDGKQTRSDSHDITLMGKMDDLGHVKVRIRTDQDLEAQQQAMIELQAQRKGDYEQAWAELGKIAQQLLSPPHSR